MKYYIMDGSVFNEQGNEVGSKQEDGYITFNESTPLGVKHWLVHRYIWTQTHGDIPNDYEIDHIDGNRSNNRIDNLRLASRSENQYNSKLRQDNKSGVKGVSWDKKAKQWVAKIKQNKTRYYLGYFKSLEDAKKIVEEKRAELHAQFARNN